MKHLRLFLLTVLALTALNFSAKSTTVVDIVVNSADHTTLEAAVVAAGLVETLQGEGPFTVFAPTDAAFAALPEGTIDALLADIPALTDILTYHVVGGKAMSTDLSDGQMIATVNGKEIEVTINEEGVFINNAKVTVADIEADNGVVHVIDAVLLPPVTVFDIINESANHQTLEVTIKQAGLDEALQGKGPFTVFAPTDRAFAAIPVAELSGLINNLSEFLLYHVVSGKVMSSELSGGQIIESLSGKDLSVFFSENDIYINGSKVIVADIETDNGVVHVIDAVFNSADVQLRKDTEFGNIITDRNGNSLYFFSRDADGTSACSGGCLNNWPVFYVENMQISQGLNPDYFGSITRADGTMQTTYKGWPLYYFVNDNAPGDVNGDGVIGKWFVAKPDYTIMLSDNQLTGNDGIDYKGDYTPGEEIVQYLTDNKGLTLYTWKNDLFESNNFTDEAFAKNAVWPIYEQDKIVLPSILNAEDFSVIDVFGRSQLTFKGWPLYYFGQDMMVRGNTKGVSVPAPGVWPVAVPGMMNAPEFGTVVDIATGSEDFSILVAALTREDLTIDFLGALTGAGPFTVFAPTNAAFAALLAELGATSLDDIDTATLEAVLQMHVLAGKVMSTDLSEGLTAETLLGEMLTFSLEGGPTLTDPNGRVSSITAVDIEAQNGVVHVIDKVILPLTTSITSFDEMKFDFYPNPATGYITVRTEESGNTLRIVDISGKLMHTEKLVQPVQRVELQGLTPGMYFISIDSGSKKVTQKLIVR